MYVRRLKNQYMSSSDCIIAIDKRSINWDMIEIHWTREGLHIIMSNGENKCV